MFDKFLSTKTQDRFFTVLGVFSLGLSLISFGISAVYSLPQGLIGFSIALAIAFIASFFLPPEKDLSSW